MNKMRIHITKEMKAAGETPDITEHDLDVDESYTVAYLKSILNIEQGRQFETTVMYGSRELTDDDVLKDAGVTEGSSIGIQIEDLLLDAGLPSARIIVLTNSGERIIPGALNSQKKIGELKVNLSIEMDIEPEKLRFVYNGLERSDQEVIGDLGILEDDLKNYILCFGPRFEDFILVGYTLELRRR